MQTIRQGILTRKLKSTGNLINIESTDKEQKVLEQKVQNKKERLDKINDHRTKLFLGNREDKREIV
jgi:hypothetical protein